MVTGARLESTSRKVFQTGVTISPSEICAADLRLRGSTVHVDHVWRAPLDPPPTDGGPWSSLAAALTQLAAALAQVRGSLAVALMPPLTEVRGLELPALREEELQRLLTRNAGRYFVHARGPQLVGATTPARAPKGALSPVVAAAASARLIAAVRSAAEQSGWTIDVIAPAESAWAAAATALWPAFAKRTAWLVVAQRERADLLRLEAGRLVAVRRLRAGGVDVPMIADAIGHDGRAGRVGVAGATEDRRAISAALSASGITATLPSGEWAGDAGRPDALAASFAGSGMGPVLRPEEAVVEARARARSRAVVVAGAAAVLLVAAAAVELWGVHRQLGIVERERAEIRPQISSTLVGRTTVEATYRHLQVLDAVDQSAPRWSAVIAALSDAIPRDAHLTAIRAREDSLIVDGLAEHAARVFDALAQSKLLTDVNAPAPVRREPQPDGPVLDHFTIAARLARPGTRAATQTARSPVPANHGAGK